MNRTRDLHSEPGDRPVRRDAKYRTVFDSAGQRHDILLEGQVITLSEDGSIDCATVSVAHFYHCGHPATDAIGGACSEPGCCNISCKACFTQSRCASCLKPVCLEHVQQLRRPEGPTILCGRCMAELIRKQRWQAFFRAVLSPFVDFDSRKQS